MGVPTEAIWHALEDVLAACAGVRRAAGTLDCWSDGTLGHQDVVTLVVPGPHSNEPSCQGGRLASAGTTAARVDLMLLSSPSDAEVTMETSHKGYRIQYEQGHDGWMCRIFRPNGVLMLNCPIAPTRTDEGS